MQASLSSAIVQEKPNVKVGSAGWPQADSRGVPCKEARHAGPASPPLPACQPQPCIPQAIALPAITAITSHSFPRPCHPPHHAPIFLTDPPPAAPCSAHSGTTWLAWRAPRRRSRRQSSCLSSSLSSSQASASRGAAFSCTGHRARASRTWPRLWLLRQVSAWGPGGCEACLHGAVGRMWPGACEAVWRGHAGEVVLGGGRCCWSCGAHAAGQHPLVPVRAPSAMRCTACPRHSSKTLHCFPARCPLPPAPPHSTNSLRRCPAPPLQTAPSSPSPPPTWCPSGLARVRSWWPTCSRWRVTPRPPSSS
jgi:hypothetical protein